MIVSTETRSPDLVTSSVRTGPAPAIFMLSIVVAAADAAALGASEAAPDAAADAEPEAAALGAAALAATLVAALGAPDVVAVPQPAAIKLITARLAAARVVHRRLKTLPMCSSSKVRRMAILCGVV